MGIISKKNDDKELKWLPFFSYLSFLVSLIFSSSMLCGMVVGGGTLTLVLSVIAIINVFPEYFSSIREYWIDEIMPTAHIILISISLAISLISIIIFFKNYRIICVIKNK